MPEKESARVLAQLQELYNKYELIMNTTMGNSTNISSESQILADDIDEILFFCGNVQEYQFWQTWQNFVFWCEGILILLVGSLGLLGNILATYILSSSEEMQWTTFNYLLICLSVFDIFFLICSVPVHVFPIPGMAWLNAVHNTRMYCIIYRFVLYPFSSVTYTAGVFITLAMTIERFQAVCYPHYYRNSLVTSTPLRRALKFIITAIFAALFLEAPKFLEVEVHEEGNGTTTCEASELSTDATFVDWKNKSSIVHPFFTTTAVPIILLFVMNTFIYRGIIASQKRQSVMHPGQQINQSASKLQAVLIIICLLFVITHFPRLILAVLAFVQRPKATRCASYKVQYIPALYVVCMETVSNLLIHANASSNLLIFSCTSVQFKDVFCQKFLWLFGSFRSSTNAANNIPSIEEATPSNIITKEKQQNSIKMGTLSSYPKTLPHNHQIAKTTSTSSNVLHTCRTKARKRFASMSDLPHLQEDEAAVKKQITRAPTVPRKI